MSKNMSKKITLFLFILLFLFININKIFALENILNVNIDSSQKSLN